ncbi:hypothetical protein M3Y99_00217900 [Aphelenchoides fujianensis]|nr:hypothetical protein M3Y99_00217900 [Aphelenchoides fujianensis]
MASAEWNTPAVELHAVAEQLAVGEPSVSRLLGDGAGTLNFVLLFHCFVEDFAMGVCGLRWKRAAEWTGDLAARTALVDVAEREAAFRPPFAPGTRLVVAVRRTAERPDELQFCFQRDGRQSGVYSLPAPPGRDHLAVRCPDARMITSDLIRLLNGAQYALVCREERAGRCVRCFVGRAAHRPAGCEHVVYCAACRPPTGHECAVCYARTFDRRPPRFFET